MFFVLLLLGACFTKKQPLTIGLGVDFGSRSHARGLLELGISLQGLGHHVVFATTEEKMFFADGYNLTTVSLGSYPDYIPEVQKLINAHVLDRNPRGVRSALDAFQKKVLPGIYEVTYKGFTDYCYENRVDVWVCDLTSASCKDAATHFKIPYMAISQVKEFFGLGTAPFITDGIGLLPIYVDQLSFISRLLNKAPTLVSNLMSDAKKLFSPSASIKNDVILLDTFVGLEPAVSLPPNIKLIGPILPKGFPALDSSLQTWLDQHPRVMYAGFGSEIGIASFDFENILLGAIHALNDNSIDGFIWSYGTFNTSLIPNHVFVNGVSVNTKQLISEYQSKIYIKKWHPQRSILNHPNTKLFLTHGGMSSIQEAIHSNVPTLCYPMSHDQPRNAYKLREAGIGIFVDRLTTTPKQIANSIKQILDEEGGNFKVNLVRLRIIADIDTNAGIDRVKNHAAQFILNHAYTAQVCRPTLGSGCELEHLTVRSNRVNHLIASGLDIKLFLLVSSIQGLYLLYKLFYWLIRLKSSLKINAKTRK